MTEPRLASGLLVSSLLRRIGTQGGHGAVLAKGDATAGAILLVLAERGVTRGLVERGRTADGKDGWVVAGPRAIDEPGQLTDYIARRRRSDPDLWVVELDGPRDALAELG
ncbi:MAG: hypothetical protein JWM38_1671 [Sphingomonas bacterium]|nr:hypothetical protein [Sphingomonas bacterium]MDB5718244.1 hypothetical protein [Sphingomonas bacterium]